MISREHWCGDRKPAEKANADVYGEFCRNMPNSFEEQTGEKRQGLIRDLVQLKDKQNMSQ